MRPVLLESLGDLGLNSESSPRLQVGIVLLAGVAQLARRGGVGKLQAVRSLQDEGDGADQAHRDLSRPPRSLRPRDRPRRQRLHLGHRPRQSAENRLRGQRPIQRSHFGSNADDLVRVCDRYVGANAFPLVAALFWLYMLQPDRNMLVSGVLAAYVAPEQHVWAYRHNQIGII